MIKTLPEEVEAYRDRIWRREPESRVETAVEAEKLAAKNWKYHTQMNHIGCLQAQIQKSYKWG